MSRGIEERMGAEQLVADVFGMRVERAVAAERIGFRVVFLVAAFKSPRRGWACKYI